MSSFASVSAVISSAATLACHRSAPHGHLARRCSNRSHALAPVRPPRPPTLWHAKRFKNKRSSRARVSLTCTQGGPAAALSFINHHPAPTHPLSSFLLQGRSADIHISSRLPAPSQGVEPSRPKDQLTSKHDTCTCTHTYIHTHYRICPPHIHLCTHINVL